MSKTSEERGEIGQCDRPNWDPLVELVGKDVTREFMWMYQVDLEPRGHLQAYKHVESRRYLHLDSRGETYVYRGSRRYQRVPVVDALVPVFASLPVISAGTREQLRGL